MAAPKRKLVCTAYPDDFQRQYINGIPLNPSDVRDHQRALRNEDSFRAIEAAKDGVFKVIEIEELKRLPDDLIWQLAILGTHALTCTIQGLPQEVKKAIRQEREALKALPNNKAKYKKTMKSIRRRNRKWIESLIEVWLAIRS